MALCKKCLFYSQSADELERNYNDVGAQENHYCVMYQDAIPDGVYDGGKDCEFYESGEK